jgi:hypothetical protein
MTFDRYRPSTAIAMAAPSRPAALQSQLPHVTRRVAIASAGASSENVVADNRDDGANGTEVMEETAILQRETE